MKHIREHCPVCNRCNCKMIPSDITNLRKNADEIIAVLPLLEAKGYVSDVYTELDNIFSRMRYDAQKQLNQLNK